MKLYYTPGACSFAVHLALHEVGARFEAIKVELPAHTLPDGSNYHDISPRGYVPLLEFDDGSRHTEVGALLQYVGDLDASQALIGPYRSSRRQSVIEWLTFIGTELHKAFSPLWREETPAPTRIAATQALNRRFAELEQHFSRHDYLAGDFSVADAYCYTILNWTRFLDIPLGAYPKIQAYLARVGARPAVQATMQAEALNQPAAA